MFGRQYGEVSYTLTDMVIARLDINAGTYGTPVRVAGGQMLVFEPEHDTDKMREYGAYGRMLSIAIGATVQFKAGGVDMAALEVVGAVDIDEYGITPNRYRRVKREARVSMPYFGAIGRMATDDGGAWVAGVRAVMLDKLPNYMMDGESNKFNIWETNGYALPLQDASGKTYLDYSTIFEDFSDWERPETAEDFLAFFNED